jgi:uncharacterized membrane protein
VENKWKFIFKNTGNMSKKITNEIFPIFLIVLSFFASVYFYLHFPARVPTHWNYSGQIDGWSSGGFAAFFFPFLNLGIYLLLTFIPMIDPKKENIDQFGKYYIMFKSAMVFFMTAVYFMVGFAGLGYNIPIGTYVPVMVGFLFIFLGNYLEKIKMNWTIGMRNPWTLSSETVWNKTNRLTGKLFMIAGVLIAMEAITPKVLIIPVFIFAISMIIVVPTVYSYLLFKKEKKEKSGANPV